MCGTDRLRIGGAVAGLLASFLAASPVLAAPARRSVHYHGLALRIPRSWPVIDLSREPHACVRFDRHALYLGTPNPDQRCPAHAVGRTEALLIQPVGAARAGLRPEGNATTFLIPSAGVQVTATWSRTPRLVASALGRRSLPAAPRASAASAGPLRRVRPRQLAYTGLGFDACSAPSTATMSAWAASPYRAVGIYIGGVNSACSQPNLSASWVSHEVGAGWHPIPIYVGLQAPNNLCGCQAMSVNPARAAAQGRAAASDAVAQAQALGIPAGNALYNDMEGYTRGPRNKRAVLAFLAGWTSKLHALGYSSGVYSSARSGIHDLASQYGTTYSEPDDIWIADWNGVKSTSDRYVPSADWPNHQRLHQYLGGRNETYGGVTLNVDDDYLDGATASRRDGYTVLTSDGAVHTFGAAINYGSDAGNLPSGVSAVSLAGDRATGGYWILKSNGGVNNFHAPGEGSLRNKLGGLVPVALAAPPEGGYMILTSDGGVHPFGPATSYGDDAGKLPTGVTAVAVAIDPATHGYWILRSDGGVDNFNAPWLGSLKNQLLNNLPAAIAAAPQGGYLILIPNGGVRKFGPAAKYGSDYGHLPAGVTAVSLATSPRLAGYRLLRSDGGVDSFDATWSGSLLGSLQSGVTPVGIVSGG